jgi:hypothetical protein
VEAIPVLDHRARLCGWYSLAINFVSGTLKPLRSLERIRCWAVKRPDRLGRDDEAGRKTLNPNGGKYRAGGMYVQSG